MIIRAMRPDDLPQLVEIHARFYAEQFTMPDFARFVATFVVEDESRIITGGGIRALAECAILTDKSHDLRTKFDALQKAFDVSKFMASANRFDQLFAIVHDESWYEQLVRQGFVPTSGRLLQIDVR